MPITFQKTTGIFNLETENSSYQFRICPEGILEHLYYGRSISGADMRHLRPAPERGFSSGGFPFDISPAEYPGSGLGDFRISAVNPVNPDCSRSADFRYIGHEIRPGKYTLPGLPSVRGTSADADTLIVSLRDVLTGLCADLYYAVFPQLDVITRAVCLRNEGSGTILLEKAASVCIDFPFADFDLIHFPGGYGMERGVERAPLRRGIHTVSSQRGVSSHHENPFVILCDHAATEEYGACLGFMPVYSGNHKTEVELDCFGHVRLVSGIHDEGFSWVLEAGASFAAPEVILSYSHRGLGQLSRNYHRLIRENLCPPQFKGRKGEVLLNSWEAAYFDYDEKILLAIAREAASLGIDRFVLDDGWFGKRNDDTSSLGDWQANPGKLPGGLTGLAEKICQLGLSFGLWIEPEMISEDSDLYRNHPDWAVREPGRTPEPSRNQLVLDMTRADVRDYLFHSIDTLLSQANITYLKWDFNRPLTNAFSALLGREHQGEFAHRFILGTYELLSRLQAKWPDVLIEGCTAGGGRFDAGMLYYCPQIWCSDNTDALCRLKIQEGTSFGYPVRVMGSHVSAIPNHQTGRSIPLRTRSIVAMSGTYGFELDPRRLSPEEKSAVQEEIRQFGAYENLIREGDYYRLASAFEKTYSAWEFVSSDHSRALLNVVFTAAQPELAQVCIRLQGLLENAVYVREDTGKQYTGAALMYGGLVLSVPKGDDPGVQIFFKEIDM